MVTLVDQTGPEAQTHVYYKKAPAQATFGEQVGEFLTEDDMKYQGYQEALELTCHPEWDGTPVTLVSTGGEISISITEAKVH